VVSERLVGVSSIHSRWRVGNGQMVSCSIRLDPGAQLRLGSRLAMAAVGRLRVGIQVSGPWTCFVWPVPGRWAVTRNVLHLPVRPDGLDDSRRWLAGWRAKDLLSIFRGSGE
jgi:hypothetical protein